MRNSKSAESDLNLPPGFRFHPTDEELVVHYLCRKASKQRIPVQIIAEIDLYKFDPWDLPGMAMFGTKEWYFFTPRDRKYPNGSRPNRAAGRGYWKATGADKPVAPVGKKTVGIKKALVFYDGKAPKGKKTDWIMHEYRLADVNRTAKANGSLRLDDWVLCRLYNKKNNWGKIGRNLVEENEDLVSVESLMTPESGIEMQDLDEFWEKKEIKEEYDWCSDLNLGDFEMPLVDFEIQDYNFLSFESQKDLVLSSLPSF